MKNILIAILLVLFYSCTFGPKDPNYSSNIGLGSFKISQKLEDCEAEAQSIWGASPIKARTDKGMYVKEYYWSSYPEPIEVIATPNDHTICKIVCHFDGDIYTYERVVKEFKSIFPSMQISSHSESSGDFDYIYTTLSDPSNKDCITAQYSHYKGQIELNQINIYITNSQYTDYLNGISKK